MNKYLSPQDIHNALYNKQTTIVGAITVGDTINKDKVYFIIAVSGSGVTIKDVNGVIVFVTTTSIVFPIPLRIKEGFSVAGTDPVVTYAEA